MKNINIESARSESGFTLVELAVVMIIIGLLVGGILKGQEMIANAQVTSTVAQIKAVDAATGTFRDIYDAMPGDMANAGNRLTNCAGACVVAAAAGVGDSRLVNSPLAAAGNEENAFFPQLQAADLISGVNGRNFVDAEIAGNEVKPGYTNGAAVGLLAAPRAGHYLAVVQTGTAGTAGIKPIDAARMDRKMDDGLANSGSAGGVAGAGACADAAGVYDEDSQALNCGFVARIQG